MNTLNMIIGCPFFKHFYHGITQPIILTAWVAITINQYI